MTAKVFVYGSLKRGFHNHVLLKEASYLGETSINGYKMVSLGAYPGIISAVGETPPVKGEVYEVDRPTMAALDRLEGHPHFYMRFPIYTEFGPAWVYTLPEKGYEDRPVVESGEWRKAA